MVSFVLLLALFFLMLATIDPPQSALRPCFGNDLLRHNIPLILQFSPLLLLECHPDGQDEKDLHALHEEFKTDHSLM